MRRKKEEILDDLISNLREIIEILEKDPIGQWTRGFKSFLETALELQSSGYPEQEIRDFCGGIRSIFGGAGSFNDYSPSPEIHGAKKFGSLSNRLYALADEIRTIGTY
jgi:hypothetical protein